ncbi:hypothetical protein RSOLAG22IIIB_01957 [Rhizoctonia solani]|uniref:Transmembrane protein n=1 Tax=Rhizoctonia solani TaxID=456999 RepID=A0A0K6GC73_9AGAM|nr:hypothetical protein RSOLAG22IIIB_01957 [Rhizoctonia solani]
MSNMLRGRSMPPPPRVPPTRSMTELTEPLNSQQPGASLGAYETRQRTQLVVDGFSNLALLAILFCGVQAQFISITSSDNSNATARATNATLFGGLILSVCSALLATLSGRWFSILREDDSEFLSSHWLAAESRQKSTPIKEYLKFQREVWLSKLPFQLQQHYSQPLSPEGNKEGSSVWNNTITGSPIQDSGMIEMEAGVAGQRYLGHPPGPSPNPRERDVQFVISLIDEELNGDTTIREKIVSKILLCAVGICCSAFALFAVAIMLLVWNTQPFDVALSTTILLALNLILMPGFFLKHRHKRVISQLSLGRAAL